MAMFGDLGKAFHKVIRNPVFQVVFPVVAIANIAAEKVVAGVAKRENFVSSPGRPAESAREVGGTRAEYSPYGSDYGPNMPYGGYSFGGGQWDSLTGLESYSPMLAPAYFQGAETFPGESSPVTSWEALLAHSLSR